jgi:hypothetical protein
MLSNRFLWCLALASVVGPLGGTDCQVYDESILSPAGPTGFAGAGGSGGRTGDAGQGLAGSPVGPTAGSAGVAGPSGSSGAGGGGTAGAGGGTGGGGGGEPEPIFCKLQFPLSFCMEPGSKASIFGRIKVAGRTDLPTQAPGIQAEFGSGPAGTDPRVSPGWVFQPASFNVGHDPAQNDTDEYQYEAEAKASAGSSFSYIYRFQVDDQVFYCDRDGVGGAAELTFDLLQMGSVVIRTVCPPP